MKEVLYKRTAIGVYSFETVAHATLEGGVIKTYYGLVNGRKITNTLKGDLKKFTALVKKKRQEGYRSLSDVGAISVDEMDRLLPIYSSDAGNDYKPMKCQPFVSNKFDYSIDAYGQPKINGNRATIRYAMSKEGLFSREKVIIKSHDGIVLNIKHIEYVFESVFKYCPKDTVFDGEIYYYGQPVTSISGAAKNPKNPIHKDLTYHCFDLAIPDIDQSTRLSMKHKYLKKIEFPGTCEIQKYIGQHAALAKVTIVDVIDVPIRDDEEASALRDICLEAGYEGCVIRNPDANYRFGSRPKTMMKLKKPKYGYFEVLDIVMYGNTNDNNVGVGCKFILRNDINSSVFESNPIGNTDERIAYYDNRKNYIGIKVMVKYFERTINGIPFHSNVILKDNPVAT
jgi:hypothetical protein